VKKVLKKAEDKNSFDFLIFLYIRINLPYNLSGYEFVYFCSVLFYFTDIFVLYFFTFCVCVCVISQYLLNET